MTKREVTKREVTRQEKQQRTLPPKFIAGWVLAILVCGLLVITQTALHAQKIIPNTKASPKHVEKISDTWQVIHLGAQRIGYSRTTSKPGMKDGRKIVHTVTEMKMTIKRFGQSTKMLTTLETDELENGDLISFEFSMRNPPASSTVTTGYVEDNRLIIETTIAGRKSKKSINWDTAVKSPTYQDRLLRENMLKPGETRSFKTFLPEYNKITSIKMVADDYRYVKLFDGKARKLLKVRITQAVLPTLPIRAYLDEQGTALKTVTDFLGSAMITYTVPKEEALKTIAGAELDIAVGSLVRVRRIRNAHNTKKIVYEITTPGEDAAKHIVNGSTQRVRKLASDKVELTVTAAPLPKGSKIVRTDPKYVGPTRFLQCNDARVLRHANAASAGETNPVRIAVRMERYVSKKLSKKNFSTALASAAEVAENLEGDCTEHAVLLAAMLRAKNIPSRIAVGLVYVDLHSAFGGHMWTEAWLDGKWIPLDATLGKGGIGAAHIKLAESSFSDDSPAPVTTFLPLLTILGKMKIKVLRVE